MNQMQQRTFFRIFIALFLLADCQADVADTDINDIEEKINTIPGLEGFNSSQLPSQEDVEKAIKEKCERNGGGEEAFNALKDQGLLLKTCLEGKLNYTQIQEEIEEAKKTGSMDEVFGKYCGMDIEKCVENTTSISKACLDKKEIETLDQVMALVKELKEFVCYKSGDRIAMFVAEGGLECLDSRRDQLQECANETLGSRIPSDVSVNNLPTFLFSDRDCQDMDLIRSCVNRELEQCKDSTPANIVDAFFKFLKKHTPCDRVPSAAAQAKAVTSQPSSSSVTTPTISLLFIGVFSKFIAGFII